MRPSPVVEFPSPESLSAVVDELRRVLGKLVSLGESVLVLSDGGVAVAASPTPTAIKGSQRAINVADAGIDAMRLAVYGVNSSGPIECQVYDVTASVALCSVQLSAVEGLHVGAWQTVQPFNTDHTIEFRVVGDNSTTQTIYSAVLQYRTNKA